MMDTELQEMKKHFSDIQALIESVEITCTKIHVKSNGHCGLGTDCPFHAAFEENTIYGCRLKGLKDIMKKRKRRKDRVNG
jgi:hypothetical protein